MAALLTFDASTVKTGSSTGPSITGEANKTLIQRRKSTTLTHSTNIGGWRKWILESDISSNENSMDPI